MFHLFIRRTQRDYTNCHKGLCFYHARNAPDAAAFLFLLRIEIYSRYRSVSWFKPLNRRLYCLCNQLCRLLLGNIPGGLLSVDKGQYETAQVLGLSRWQTVLRIVLPQMFKVTLPAVTNEEITLVKDTALVTAIGLTDLLHFTKSMVNTHVSVVPYFIAAIFYLVMTFGLTKLFNWLERRFAF